MMAIPNLFDCSIVRSLEGPFSHRGKLFPRTLLVPSSLAPDISTGQKELQKGKALVWGSQQTPKHDAVMRSREATY